MAWNQNSTHMDERRKQVQTEERMGALGGADMCVSMRRWVGDGSVIHSLYIRLQKKDNNIKTMRGGRGTLVVDRSSPTIGCGMYVNVESYNSRRSAFSWVGCGGDGARERIARDHLRNTEF